MAHAGEACYSLPCGAACELSADAFGKEPIIARIDPPDFWKQGDADAINLTLGPSSVCTWCYEQMYNDEVEAKGNTKQKYNYDKRREGTEKYFAQFEPKKSLIFYYSGCRNPFYENQEDNYVIVGVSCLKAIDYLYYYNNVSDDVKRKYSGGIVWQKPVISTYPEEEFCIPYWKYTDSEEILDKGVLN